MMREETYATTGPRMIVRFFGGYDFTDADARTRSPAVQGYRKGVPMGGDMLPAPAGKSPSFLVAALKDPLGANLDRIQIVKGWVDAAGERQEKVYDVVWAGDRKPGADGKLPPVGNTVDLATATWANSIGAPELISVWTDPDFDASLRAVYYVRVLEIPTPRWTAYDAVRYGVKMPAKIPMITQERAYTSPIWYTPAKQRTQARGPGSDGLTESRSMPPRFPRSLDPIVLFLVLGSCLVGLHAFTRSDTAADVSRKIVLTDADVGVIYETFRRGRMRPPTIEELRGLVAGHVRTEMLYREAVALGLDREDPALRRRLATKLELLAKDVGAVGEPTAAELAAFYDEHVERYAIEPRRAFRQIYFSVDKRGERAVADARDLVARLRKAPTSDVSEAGDPLLLESEVPPTTQTAVARDFGAEFAGALFEVEVGLWTGPIPSSFGLHVVRVDAVEAGLVPPLEAVRDRVRTDLLAQRKEDAFEKYLESLGEKYDVDLRFEMPEPDAR